MSLARAVSGYLRPPQPQVLPQQLQGLDLVVKLDQMFDEAGFCRKDREATVADENTHVLAGPAHRPG